MDKTKNIKPFKFVREYKNTLFLHYWRVKYPKYVTWARTIHFYIGRPVDYSFFTKRHRQGKLSELYFAFHKFRIIWIDFRTYGAGAPDMIKYYSEKGMNI